jgi:hypothetical protein
MLCGAVAGALGTLARKPLPEAGDPGGLKRYLPEDRRHALTLAETPRASSESGRQETRFAPGERAGGNAAGGKQKKTPRRGPRRPSSGEKERTRCLRSRGVRGSCKRGRSPRRPRAIAARGEREGVKGRTGPKGPGGLDGGYQQERERERERESERARCNYHAKS